MLHPTHLLRDAAPWALCLVISGAIFGGFLVPLGVGASFFLVNLVLLRVVVGHGGPWVLVRMGLKLPLATAGLLFLARDFDALGLVLGFGTTLLVMSVRLALRARTLEIA